MSEAVWKAYVGGEKLGPVDEATLRGWIADGQVTQQTQVWRPGLPKWLRAGEVEELADAFEAEAPPEPTPAADPPETEAATAEAETGAPEAETGATSDVLAVDAPIEPPKDVDALPPLDVEQSAGPGEAPGAVPDLPDVDAGPTYDLADEGAASGSSEAVKEHPTVPSTPSAADDEAATVVQQSPFADSDDVDTGWHPAPTPRPEAPEIELPSEPAVRDGEFAPAAVERAVAQRAPSGRDMERQRRPIASRAPETVSRPLFPFFLALLVLIPAGSGIYLMRIQTFGFSEGVGLVLQIAALVGGALVLFLPLLYRRFAMWMALVGAVLWLGGWVAYQLYAYQAFEAAGWGLGAYVSRIYLDLFQSGETADKVMGVMYWSMMLVPLIAIFYFLFSRKYRAYTA